MPCHSAHKTFKGRTQENDFISSSPVLLGVSFWARVLPSIAEFIGHQLLRDGGFSVNLEPTQEGLSRVFSLAASSSSWSTFYRSWLTGDLTKLQLLEYVCHACHGGRVIARYCSNASGLAGSFVDLCLSPSVPVPLSPAVAFPSASSSSTRVLSLKARSRTPRRSKTPLLLVEPRGMVMAYAVVEATCRLSPGVAVLLPV